MLKKNGKNSEVCSLYKWTFVAELLIDALFKPSSRVNPEHKPKYIFVLSYAASVTEVFKKVKFEMEMKRSTVKFHIHSLLHATLPIG